MDSAGVSKVSTGVSVASVPTLESALVAGIDNGAVFINKGSTQGVKPGDRFKIIRTIESALIDPATQKHLTSKRTICTLTVNNVDEGNASGSCEGGIPQANDVAQPVPH